MKKNNLIIGGAVLIVVGIIGIVALVKNNRAENNNAPEPVVTETDNTAITPAPADTATTIATVPLEGTLFTLVAVNGKLAPTGSAYTVAFNEGTIQAKFCNGVGGSYTVADYVISAPALMSTLMYCEEPKGLMETEQLFSRMMTTGARATVTGDVLELKSGTDQMIFEYKR